MCEVVLLTVCIGLMTTKEWRARCISDPFNLATVVFNSAIFLNDDYRGRVCVCRRSL